MLLSGVLGCPNGKTIHSSKLFFEDSFDELKVVIVAILIKNLRRFCADFGILR